MDFIMVSMLACFLPAFPSPRTARATNSMPCPPWRALHVLAETNARVGIPRPARGLPWSRRIRGRRSRSMSAGGPSKSNTHVRRPHIRHGRHWVWLLRLDSRACPGLHMRFGGWAVDLLVRSLRVRVGGGTGVRAKVRVCVLLLLGLIARHGRRSNGCSVHAERAERRHAEFPERIVSSLIPDIQPRQRTPRGSWRRCAAPTPIL